MNQPSIINITAGTVDKLGFFCAMSKKKAPGYLAKKQWLKERFAEGLHIKMLELPQRGMIEYLPGEHAWRPVNAEGYMFIHCLWVVGQSKGKGLSSFLLQQAEDDARKEGKLGVAMATSEAVWLAGSRALERRGYECVDEAPPSFKLMVKRFGEAPAPSFAGNWEKKAKKFGKGFTVLTTPQCPYIPDAAWMVQEAAMELELPCQIVELKSAKEIRQYCPSAYGTFSIVFDGKLFSYHYLLKKDILDRFGKTE